MHDQTPTPNKIHIKSSVCRTFEISLKIPTEDSEYPTFSISMCFKSRVH